MNPALDEKPIILENSQASIETTQPKVYRMPPTA
jgi:hypothetical protein